MLSDELFEREKRAYALIRQSIADMLGRGYEIRTFDNVPAAQFDLLFVGPSSDKEKPDVQRLVIPYQFLSLVAGDDENAMAEFNWHVKQITEATRRMHSFLHELILRKLEDRRNDSGNQRYQA